MVALIAASALIYIGSVYQEYIRVQSTRIGVIRVSGSIDNLTYADQARAAQRDPNIKAVVVVIDSGGGLLEPCLETEVAFRELKAEKPVIVTMGQYAASGAYLISTASDYIFAHYATVTAGVGVLAVWISYENKWKEEGIDYYWWTTGERKDIGAPWRPPTAEESEYMQNLVDGWMDEIMKRIQFNRPKIENIDGLRDGSTMLGYEAFERKLVDELGDYQDALRKAEELSHLKKGSYITVELGS